MYEVLNADFLVNYQLQLEIEKHVLRSESIDFKTGTLELDTILTTMGKSFWQNIVSVVSINNAYYQCLLQIMDNRKFQNLEDVVAHVNSVLKIDGDDQELIGSELLATSKKYMEKIGIVLNEKLQKPQSSNLHSSKISALSMDVAQSKRRMKIAENSIAQLQKEKKDLLNILASYDSENIHKISLEKRLEAEQQKNNELRDLISTIFKKKMPSQ